MEIWLKKDNQKIQLPVLPESYEITVSHNNQVVNINSLGDINLHGNSGLRSITLTSFFPKYDYYFNVCKAKKPYKYVEIIENWRNKGYIRLIITGTPINMLCTIDTFTYGEYNRNGDVGYTIELTEYKIIKKSSNTKTPSKTDTKIEKTSTNRDTKDIKSTKYTVKKGDTLWAISKKVTGSSNNWRAIYNQNKKVIGTDPNKIYPGQELNIKID